MTKLIFATNNINKVIEVRSLLDKNRFEILSLKEAGISTDIPEPYDTLEKNAVEKASVIYSLTNTSCFAEDTGLEVEALNGEPGVRSARYAGEHKDFNDNIYQLLDNLRDKTNRSARFKTIICLMQDGKPMLFDGICKGNIISEKRGKNGFGYDPVFVPEGSSKTFAEMDLYEKNHFSHRKKATEKLIAYLENHKTINDTLTKPKD